MADGSKIRKVIVRAYSSPTLVFLAFDWPDGASHADFLGFAIQRNPGYGASGAPQYLFNKIGFTPQPKGARPLTSDKAPIQQFNWWDGGIDEGSSGKTFAYTVTPVLGTGPTDLTLLEAAAATVTIKVPNAVVKGIGTYFNRAVVSSQSFLKMRNKPIEAQMAWLANGIQSAVPEFISATAKFDCAIYHLTDTWKITPALESYAGDANIVYYFKPPSAAGKGGDDANLPARALLETPKRRFKQRTKIASIMHDKFIVAYEKTSPAHVLMGSMNFTPEGATV